MEWSTPSLALGDSTCSEHATHPLTKQGTTSSACIRLNQEEQTPWCIGPSPSRRGKKERVCTCPSTAEWIAAECPGHLPLCTQRNALPKPPQSSLRRQPTCDSGSEWPGTGWSLGPILLFRAGWTTAALSTGWLLPGKHQGGAVGWSRAVCEFAVALRYSLC